MYEHVEHAKTREDTRQEANRAAAEDRWQGRLQDMTILRSRNRPRNGVRQHEAGEAGRGLEEGDEGGPSRKTLKRRAARKRPREKHQKQRGARGIEQCDAGLQAIGKCDSIG